MSNFALYSNIFFNPSIKRKKNSFPDYKMNFFSIFQKNQNELKKKNLDKISNNKYKNHELNKPFDLDY